MFEQTIEYSDGGHFEHFRNLFMKSSNTLHTIIITNLNDMMESTNLIDSGWVKTPFTQSYLSLVLNINMFFTIL